MVPIPTIFSIPLIVLEAEEFIYTPLD